MEQTTRSPCVSSSYPFHPHVSSPRVVIIGGGTGLPRVINGLLDTGAHISAGVTTFDNGGDAGYFRAIDGSPSFGDIARAIVPFSPRKHVTKRFEKKVTYHGEEHKVRNIFTSKLYRECQGDFKMTINRLHDKLKVTSGEAIPTSLEPAHLFARLANGQVIEGETKIDIPQHDGTLRITDIWLEPSVPANPRFLEVIKEADYIVFSIGDLYTSVFAAMLPEGIKEAIRASRAQKIMMLNLMTKWGETYSYQVDDFLEAYDDFFRGDTINRILANSDIPSAQVQHRYRSERAQWIWVDNARSYSDRLVSLPLLAPGELVRHDPALILKAFEKMYPQDFSSHAFVDEKFMRHRA